MSPKSTAQRVAEHNERLIESGGTVMRIRLTPEANAILNAITHITKESRTTVINRMLMDAGNPSGAKD